MKKIILSALFLFCFASFAFAQADQLTLTTYYPAPFGMYQEMRVMGKLGVGTTDPKNKLDVNGSVVIGSYAGSAMAPVNGLIVSGKVGVGTTDVTSLAMDIYAPAAQGDVAVIRGSDYSTGFVKADSGARYGADIQATGVCANAGVSGCAGLRVNSPNKAVIVETGRVGVGTTVPAAGFHVKAQPGLTGSLDADAFFEGKVGVGSTKTYDAPFNITDSVAWNPALVVKKTGTGSGLSILHNNTINDSTPSYMGLYVYSNQAHPYWAIYQDGLQGRNFFNGVVGVGSTNPRARLDVGAVGLGSVSKATPLLSVGTAGSITSGATFKLFGTMLASQEASFGGTVRFYENIQLVPYSQDCTNDRIGTIKFYWPIGGATLGLQICAPCKTSNPGAICSTTPNWVTIASWAINGINPNPPPVVEPELPSVD